MNACKKFREFILTDYIDGQAGSRMVKQLEKHLHDCSACRELVKAVKDKTVMPFALARRQEVPPDLWSSIKGRIEQEQTIFDSARNGWDQWTQALAWPRFAAVLAGFVLLVSITALLVGRFEYQARESEQREYWEYVFASSDTAPDTGSGDLGTPIEQYFL